MMRTSLVATHEIPRVHPEVLKADKPCGDPAGGFGFSTAMQRRGPKAAGGPLPSPTVILLLTLVAPAVAAISERSRHLRLDPALQRPAVAAITTEVGVIAARAAIGMTVKLSPLVQQSLTRVVAIVASTVVRPSLLVVGAARTCFGACSRRGRCGYNRRLARSSAWFALSFRCIDSFQHRVASALVIRPTLALSDACALLARRLAAISVHVATLSLHLLPLAAASLEYRSPGALSRERLLSGTPRCRSANRSRLGPARRGEARLLALWGRA